MAEIKVTNRAGKKARPESGLLKESTRSAPSGVGTGALGAGGSAVSAFDADERPGVDQVSSPDTGSAFGGRAAPGHEVNAPDSETAGGQDGTGGLNISFGAGAITVNDTGKSPEEIACEIVKPLSRELKKLGYLSS